MAKLESPHTFSGLGWISPNEVQGSTQPRIGGGRQGGVPVQNSYRGSDTSALTEQVWSKFTSSARWSSNGGATRFDVSPTTTHFGDARRYNFNTSTFICRSLSECEPCPSSKRNHPFCRPYGNRRLVACRNMLDSGSVQENLPKPFQSVVKPATDMEAPPTELEFQGWEACGKVVAVETRDYLEFVVSQRERERHGKLTRTDVIN